MYVILCLIVGRTKHEVQMSLSWGAFPLWLCDSAQRQYTMLIQSNKTSKNRTATSAQLVPMHPTYKFLVTLVCLCNYVVNIAKAYHVRWNLTLNMMWRFLVSKPVFPVAAAYYEGMTWYKHESFKNSFCFIYSSAAGLPNFHLYFNLYILLLKVVEQRPGTNVFV